MPTQCLVSAPGYDACFWLGDLQFGAEFAEVVSVGGEAAMDTGPFVLGFLVPSLMDMDMDMFELLARASSVGAREFFWTRFSLSLSPSLSLSFRGVYVCRLFRRPRNPPKDKQRAFSTISRPDGLHSPSGLGGPQIDSGTASEACFVGLCFFDLDTS